MNRHTAILGLGNNLRVDGLRQLEATIKSVSRLGDIVRQSDIYTTRPFAQPRSERFYHNAVIEISTELSFEQFEKKTKSIETECGRRRLPTGFDEVCADIDIVIWDNTVMRPKEIDRDYFAIGFRQIKEDV